MDEEKISDVIGEPIEGAYIVQPPPPFTWKWCFGGDWYSCTISARGKPPNRFNRFMMKLILGIHSEIIEKEE